MPALPQEMFPFTERRKGLDYIRTTLLCLGVKGLGWQLLGRRCPHRSFLGKVNLTWTMVIAPFKPIKISKNAVRRLSTKTVLEIHSIDAPGCPVAFYACFWCTEHLLSY